MTVIAGFENEAEVVTLLWQPFLALVKHHHRPMGLPLCSLAVLFSFPAAKKAFWICSIALYK
jgi:hypothetical protein